GSKMSKSSGNSVYSNDLLSSGRALAVRYYLGSAHYRSVLDFQDGVIDEAEAAVSRIETFIKRSHRRLAETKFIKELPQDLMKALPAEFVSAMNDDLAIPAALAALHEKVRLGNLLLDEEDLAGAATALNEVQAMSEVLGINPISWSKSGGDSGMASALESLVESLITERNQARANKDFARSDAIRDQLQAAGITLEDAADRTHWSVS
ncbi:MAG: cysteine--tRNA ligase, partial [Actinobacteria bacterium]|nr:cysteine--tRNA ligase [Actinomycetota bacterium]